MSPRIGRPPRRYKKVRAPQDVVRAFWNRLGTRDWDGARQLLDEHVVVLWPATKERFEGADTFISMLRSFPEGWTVKVETAAAQANDVLAWIEVPFEDQMSWCATRARVYKGQITAAIDLWTDEGGVLVPSWRVPTHAIDGVTAVPPILPPDPAPNEEAS
jgi:hypothetical protein